MTHLVMQEARRIGRRVGLLLIDLEGQYRLTIGHGLEIFEMYKDIADPYWVALPINLRNAVSVFEPQWCCWDPSEQKRWIRQPPPIAITNQDRFPFYKYRMEFEDFVPDFAEWYAGGKSCACFVGIRSDESLNRYRTIARANKACYEGRKWTTWIREGAFNIYPIYDWKTEDVWRFHGKNPDLPYNRLYDRMYQAGLTLHQMRICQPYGDDQRKGLWLFHIIEPETWGRVVARVAGANQGATYAQESGNVLGRIKIEKPPGHTWESFAHLLLDTMPTKTADHYKDKIAVFIHWWRNRGMPMEDDGDINKGNANWKRVCKAILRNDYWCKGLSFSAGSKNYKRYKKMMKVRRARWQIFAD
jgi:predicted phosphoadenosine phosphosulfate sulfurtransferase